MPQANVHAGHDAVDGPLCLTYAIEDNPFPSLFVDITDRCNMACDFCYHRGHAADMPTADFASLCARLPFPVSLKLAGGEPTLHPDLPEFIRIGAKYGHTVYVASNGLRFTEPDFLASLARVHVAGVNFCLGLTLDGGYANAHAYEVINRRDCLPEKMAAFRALTARKIARVCLTAILVRGLNEDVIPQLLELATTHSNVVRYIHFRNAANVGHAAPTNPYAVAELKALVAPYFSAAQFRPDCVAEIHCPPESGRECCYRFRPTPRLQVSLIEFASPAAMSCPKRGRLRLGRDRIEQAFVSVFREATGEAEPPSQAAGGDNG